MRSITVTLWITLDGVVQGLGRPDEDTRGGFTHGGWAGGTTTRCWPGRWARACPGRETCCSAARTWQDFTTVWSRQTDGNPFTTRMNATTKYVVSRTLADSSAWPNSILLHGDAAAVVAELKAQPGADLGIVGSVSLVRSLHAAGLIDRYTLVICPLTLGSGARLFEGPAPLTEFELTSSVTTTKGAIIAQYARR